MMRFDPLLLAARAEFYRRAWPHRRYLDYVHSHGLDVARVSDFAGATGLMPIIDCDNGRFDWSGAGEPHLGFLCEALAEDGETVIDIVAWPIGRPDHVLSLLGRAALLGLWEALNPGTYCFDRPLVMHRTPLDWLKAGCNGAAVVNPAKAARVLLDLPGSIAAQDREHAAELYRIAHSVLDGRRIVFARSDQSRAA